MTWLPSFHCPLIAERVLRIRELGQVLLQGKKNIALHFTYLINSLIRRIRWNGIQYGKDGQRVRSRPC